MSAGWTSLVAATATAFIALLFARAAWHKFSDFTAFTGYVADYDVVPEKYVRFASMAVAAAEAVVILALLTPGGNVVGSLTAMAMLALYAGAMAINIGRGRDRIECGCGGAMQPLSWRLVIRNGVLAMIAALGLLASPDALALEEAIAALIGGFTLWAGYILVEQIMANAAFMRMRR
jgi:hypothetical protein